MPNGTTMLQNSLVVIKKLNVHLLCDPAIPLLDIYPRAMKMYTYISTEKPVPQMFTVAFFVIVKNWKYLQLVHKQTNKQIPSINIQWNTTQ